MAININSVYQKVLTLANKEQRGYITPQEFNLLSNKAQLEIFESYFYKINTAELKPKNQMVYADNIEMLEEKCLDLFWGGSLSGLGRLEKTRFF